MFNNFIITINPALGFYKKKKLHETTKTDNNKINKKSGRATPDPTTQCNALNSTLNI